ncbi:ATP synthase subunit I [Peptoclostridium sp.]|uniref:ATP synthase subunit I n=1 Tax=Peptoclostridium sp. TaxID=1904860 RepID=UPI0025D29607|nr:ATP synthase subunit I [Peptoclostridium sp.]
MISRCKDLEDYTGKLMQNVIKRVIAINFLTVLITFALGKFSQGLLFGLLFGSTISVLNFRLLALSVTKALEMSPGKAQIYASSRYLVRMLIIGAVVFVSIKAPYINTIGTIIGLLSAKLAVIQMGTSGKDIME